MAYVQKTDDEEEQQKQNPVNIAGAPAAGGVGGQAPTGTVPAAANSRFAGIDSYLNANQQQG